MDRFSNWPDVKQIKKSEKNTGTAGLIKALKHLFGDFGVPLELSSNGGQNSNLMNSVTSLQGGVSITGSHLHTTPVPMVVQKLQ